MFQRILVPVDLTEKSLSAVDTGYEFAAQSGAEVIYGVSPYRSRSARSRLVEHQLRGRDLVPVRRVAGQVT